MSIITGERTVEEEHISPNRMVEIVARDPDAGLGLMLRTETLVAYCVSCKCCSDVLLEALAFDRDREV